MGLKDFLSFEKFLTPSLVRVIYGIGIIVLTIGGLVVLSQVLGRNGGGIVTVIPITLSYLASIIFWRVICEGIMLSFRIYDRLTEIRDRLTHN